MKKSETRGPKLTESDILLKMIQISIQAKLYSQAAKYFQEYFSVHPLLTKEGKQLLSECYQEQANQLRVLVKNVNQTINEAKAKNYDIVVNKLRREKVKAEEGLVALCTEFINLIDKTASPLASDVESQVFYGKLKGDYYRYICEVVEGEEREAKVAIAKSCYENALRDAGEDFKLSDPLYLGIILNFSIFQYEVLGLRDEAIERAETAFNEAVRYLDELDDEEYKQAVIILQLYKDNLLLWREERTEEVVTAK